MTAFTENHNEIKQYLLGTLSQAARQRVEERLLTEESFFEEVLLGEDELIDQYINGALSDESRAEFEQHFLSTPGAAAKLKFGRALNRYVAQRPVVVPPGRPTAWAEQFRAFWSNQTWGLRGTLALAMIAIIASATLWRLPRTNPPTPQTFAALTLTISANNRAEGAQARSVTLPLNADALNVSLTLPDQQQLPAAGRYRVEIMNDNGETNPLEIIEQNARFVSVVIPAAQLARGQYALKLFAINAGGTEQRVNGSYFFTVE